MLRGAAADMKFYLLHVGIKIADTYPRDKFADDTGRSILFIDESYHSTITRDSRMLLQLYLADVVV